jgi:type IV pilus assembly protein PilB
MAQITEEKLRELLVEPGYIPEQKFNTAAREAKKGERPIPEVLVDKDLIEDEHLGKIIALELGYKFLMLGDDMISEDAIKTIPELVSRIQKVVVFDKTKEGLKVAMLDPGNFEMIDWLERKTGDKVITYYTTARNINRALRHYKKELREKFEDIIKAQIKLAERGKARAEDIPIIKIVDTIIEYGYQNRASDIHIEPLSESAQVRFRVDGILHNVLTIPKDIHSLIVTRIKVLSKLRTDEHFAAQDGKFSAKFEKEKFDIRVSIVPITEGEKAVIRLLAERSRKFTLEALGVRGEDLKKVKRTIKKSYGMVLSTGPTGSGKTTTLYAILKILNKPTINICTIEDPVEYDIQGVSQIQVNPKTNLTFAKGLRSIVRQDPDVIMVGEVRDEETASIAINSAMTGHLVLSTMHANTSATNLVRLMDMGIEPFLIASSVNLVLAQRLVREICTKCRQSYEARPKDLANLNLTEAVLKVIFKKKDKLTFYRGIGCISCVHTGYSGRIGIFEVLDMDDSIRELVMERANADQLQKQAIENGMTTMFEDGIKKVLSGSTSIEEIVRAISE